MATTTTIPAFTDALLAALAVDLPSVQVKDYWPGAETQSSGIWLESIERGGPQESEQVTVVMGRKQRQERYELTFIMQDYSSAQSPPTLSVARNLVFGWYAALDNLLAADQRLGTEVMQAVAAGAEYTALPVGKGWAVRLYARVRVEARLT